eukprot:12426791-Karenia_brevis.AAC.1
MAASGNPQPSWPGRPCLHGIFETLASWLRSIGTLVPIPNALQKLSGIVLLLDDDEAVLADYVPTVYSLRERCAEIGSPFARAYIEQLTQAENRHLGKPLRGDNVYMQWPSLMIFMETMSLAHPRWRQGRYLAEEILHDRRDRFLP